MGVRQLYAVARRYKAASALGLATVLVLIVVMAATALSSSSRVVLSDSTSCSGWAAASPAQQNAYAYLYIKEYATLLGSTPRVSAASVETAIDADCGKAADLGDADEVSVLGALKHQY
jgi:hypothetical protein